MKEGNLYTFQVKLSLCNSVSFKVAWMAIIYVVVNLITDIIYHYLDPRVRLGGDGA